MITRKMQFVLALSLIQAGLVYGETYKCRSSDGRVEYLDRPCQTGSVTVSTSESRAALLPIQSGVTYQTNSQNTYQESLDAMFNEAIGAGDLRRAKELALTPKHWAQIRVAETPRAKTSAEIQSEMASSSECQQAKRSYEIEAGAYNPKKEFLNAKKRVMYSACGMREPDSIDINNTVNVYR